jgi:hypothetical protein
MLNETVSSTPMDTKISLMDQLIQKNIANSKTINSSDKIDF